MITSFRGRYRFLSNFYPCVVEIEGGVCESVEHAYQASKTAVLKERRYIMSAGSFGEAKSRGHEVTLREDWDRVRLAVMYDLLTQKFDAGGTLAAKLVKTASHELVEGNNWGDRYWGISAGKGENWLGRLLMLRRAALFMDNRP